MRGPAAPSFFAHLVNEAEAERRHDLAAFTTEISGSLRIVDDAATKLM
jgi:hypothetical protein